MRSKIRFCLWVGSSCGGGTCIARACGGAGGMGAEAVGTAGKDKGFHRASTARWQRMTPGNCDQCGMLGARTASGIWPYPALCFRCLEAWNREHGVQPVKILPKIPVDRKVDLRHNGGK